MDVVYLENGDLACYNGYRFRKDKKTGYYLSSKDINGRRKRLHVYIWECEVGKIPDGLSVHHIDGNKGNNTITNFRLLSNKEHVSLHARAYTRENREDVIRNLNETVRPRASEWHKSSKGRQWHKIHYESMKDRLHQKREYVCEYCGKEFTSTTGFAKFCSNKCRSAMRRKSGVDDITKICRVCGGEYVSNKYRKTSRCEICRDKGYHSSRAV